MKLLKSVMICTLILWVSFGTWQVNADSPDTIITVANAKQLTKLAFLGRGSVTGIAWSPDGQTLAIATSVGIWLYDTAAFDKPPHLLKGWSHGVWFSPDSKHIVTNTAKNEALIWDIATEKVIDTLPGGAVLAMSQDWSLYLASDLMLRNMITNEELLVFDKDQDSLDVDVPVFDHKLSRVAYGAFVPNEAHIADMKTGLVLSHMEGVVEQGIKSLAFSPDDTVLVGGGGNQAGTDSISGPDVNYVRAWDVATGKVIFNVNDHSLRVGSVAFSPDGSLIASGSDDGTLRLREATTGLPRFTLPGGRFLAFSPDGHFIATGSAHDGTVKIWDTKTGALYGSLPEFREAYEFGTAPSNPAPLIFSPNSQLLASVNYRQNALIWQVSDNHVKQRLRHYNQVIEQFEFSADSANLMTMSRGCCTYPTIIWLWNIEQADLIGQLTGSYIDSAFDSRGYALGYSADAEWAGSDRGSLRVIDLQTNYTSVVIEYPNTYRTSLKISSDGKLFAFTDSNGQLTIWDTVEDRQKNTFNVVPKDNYGGLLISPNGKLIAVHNYGTETVSLWNIATGKLLRTLPQVKFDLQFSKDGRLLFTTRGLTQVWDVGTGKLLINHPDYDDWAESVALNTDNTIVAVGRSIREDYLDPNDVTTWSRRGTITLYEIASGRILVELNTDSDGIKGLAFSPDGRLLASVCLDDTVQLWGIEVQSF